MVPTGERTDVRLANHAWEALMTAHSALMSVFGAEGMWGDISMREYDVLYTLSKADAPLKICDVQSGVLLSQPALSRMLDRLEQRGLVSKHPDPEDRRAVRISLTEAGAALQRRVGLAHAKSVAREVGGALTADELQDLARLCGKLAGR
ncbi:MarR family transcriptional regulator [Leucobacter sp. CSA2]|uniref:MarR family transcriptional regulator n=1 Tax=Leucobacter edaphi TaxID=2796472 RepID=A0A934QC15_9MICO|nr:MarR family transcriptional regulator [Leucobacter edaphi]MBK0421673.1 MarR family transcriptional regulator [Leucobacter edaphi]